MYYFEKCLDVSRRAGDKDKEAECYQQIGLIYEKTDSERSIQYLTKFLELCIENKSYTKAGEAHRKLAEVHARNGNTKIAIEHL